MPMEHIIRGSNGPSRQYGHQGTGVNQGGPPVRRGQPEKKRIGPYKSQAALFDAARLDDPQKCQDAVENGASINFHYDRWVENGRQAWGLRVPKYVMGMYSGVSSRLFWFPPNGVSADKGDTLLMICIKCRLTNVVQWLLRKDELDKFAQNVAGNTAASLAAFYNVDYLFPADLSVPTLTAVSENTSNPPSVPYAPVQDPPVPVTYAVPVSDGLSINNSSNVVIGTAVHADSNNTQYGGPAYGGSSGGYGSSGAYGSNRATYESGDYYSKGNY